MADTLKLEIVTPDKALVSETVEEVQVPGSNGYLGILPGHAPLITELAVGEIAYRKEGATSHVAVAWGFAEVLPDKVTILAETAERAEDVDVERARQQKQRAEAQLASVDPNTNYDEALNLLRRAETRLQVAGKKHP